MKHRFTPREFALVLIPTVTLGGFAWYSSRMESVGPRGLYVEKSELVVATPRDVSRGYSHYLKVTLNYGGSKPNWWAKEDSFTRDIPVAPRLFNWALLPGEDRERTFAVGEEVFGRRDKQRVAFRGAAGRSPTNFPVVEKGAGRYIVKHFLRFGQIAPEAGQLTFQSVYALRDLKPLLWERVVRRAGENISVRVDRNPHAKIVQLESYQENSQQITVAAHIKHLARKNGQAVTVSSDNATIVDANKHRFGLSDAARSPHNTTSANGNQSLTQSHIFIGGPE